MYRVYLGIYAFLSSQFQVEKLIKELHSVPVDVSNGDIHTAEKGHLNNGVSIQHAEIGINLRETQSMLLERIASEMNRLKFYFAHAKVFPLHTCYIKLTENLRNGLSE